MADVEWLLQPRGPCNPALHGSCTCLIQRVHLPNAAHAWSCRCLIGSTCNESKQARSRRPAHSPVTSSLPDPHVCLAIMRAFNSHLDSPSHGGPGPTGNGEWRGSNQCSQSQRGGNTPAAEPRAASGPCQQTANDSTEDKRHPGLTRPHSCPMHGAPHISKPGVGSRSGRPGLPLSVCDQTVSETIARRLHRRPLVRRTR